MKNIIVKFGFQLRKNNNTRDMRVVILIITYFYGLKDIHYNNDREWGKSNI